MELLKQLSSVRSIEKKELVQFGQRLIFDVTNKDKSHQLTLEELSDISDFIYWNFNKAQFDEPFRHAALDSLFNALKKQLKGGVEDCVRICKALYIIDFCLHTRAQLRVLMWCNENRQIFDDLRTVGGRHRDFFRLMTTDFYDKDIKRMRKELAVVLLLVFDMSKLSMERDEPLEESSWLIRIIGQCPDKSKFLEESWNRFTLEVVGRPDRRYGSSASGSTAIRETTPVLGISDEPTTKTKSINTASLNPGQPSTPAQEIFANVLQTIGHHSVVPPRVETSNDSAKERSVSAKGAPIQSLTTDIPKHVPSAPSLPPFIATQYQIKPSDSNTSSKSTIKQPTSLEMPRNKMEVTAPPSSKQLIPRRPIPRGRDKLDLVQDSKLETTFHPGGVCHTHTLSNAAAEQRLVTKQMKWVQRRKLGQGGFGCVWLQECVGQEEEDKGKQRAVKEIVKAGSAGRGEIDYYRELEAIAKFSHSKYRHCFVESYGWYENEEKIFITMEYLKRGDLQQHLRRSWSGEEVRLITRQLLEGLRFMHKNDFVHRDLKPANILIIMPSPDWWVKISDFGISKREEEGTAFQTMIGSTGYLAPEVLGYDSPRDSAFRDELSITYTTAVDLWALGAIVIRLLLQRNPFDDFRLLRKYVEQEQPFPVQIFVESNISDSCINFLALVMAGAASGRPSAEDALKHRWILDGLTPDQVDNNAAANTNPQPGQSYTEELNSQFLPVKTEETAPSAAWTTGFS